MIILRSVIHVKQLLRCSINFRLVYIPIAVSFFVSETLQLQ